MNDKQKNRWIKHLVCRPLCWLSALLILFMAAPSFGDPAFASKVVEGARREIRKETLYISDYVQIAYPNGDVPSTTGVCTDLIVRAFRSAGVDLQRLLHEDRVKNPGDYPTHLWATKKPDKNIDHR